MKRSGPAGKWKIWTLLILAAILVLSVHVSAGAVIEQAVWDTGKLTQSGDNETFVKGAPNTPIYLDLMTLTDENVRPVIELIPGSGKPSYRIVSGTGLDEVALFLRDNSSMPLRKDQDNFFPGNQFRFIYSGCATLQDGSAADVVYTFRNLHISLSSALTEEEVGKINEDVEIYLCNGKQLYSTARNMPAGRVQVDGVSVHRRFVGVSVDMRVQIMQDGVPVDGVFYYGITDIDVNRKEAASAGYLYGADGCFSFSEMVQLNSGYERVFIPEAGRMYDGTPGNYLPNIRMNGDKIRFDPVFEDSTGRYYGQPDKDPGSYLTGFVALANNREGLDLSFWTSGGFDTNGEGGIINTFLVRPPVKGDKDYKHIIVSTSGPGGSIWTLNDHDNTMIISTNHTEDYLTVSNGKTVVYTMEPDTGCEIESLKVGDATDTAIYDLTPHLHGMKEGGEITQPIAEGREGILKYQGNGIYTFTFPDNNNDHRIEVTWKRKTLDIEALKIWDDAGFEDRRPGEVEIQLLADGVPVPGAVQKATAAGGWKVTFTGLHQYSTANNEIVYSIMEKRVPEGYVLERIYPLLYEIRNRYAPGMISVPVQVIWDDVENEDRIRPDHVSIWLYADGVLIRKAVVTPSDKWYTLFSELPEKDENGKEITYTVRQAVQYTFDSILSEQVNLYDVPVYGARDDGTRTITNVYRPGTVSVHVVKEWKDKPDSVPFPGRVQVYLYANGEMVDSAFLTAPGQWEHTFRDLPVKRAGVPIQYTIGEKSVPNFLPVIDQKNYRITNVYSPGKTSVQVTKAWHDMDDQDGTRPRSVRVGLYRDGEHEPMATMELSEDNHWTGIFSNLDEMDGDERIIGYAVREFEPTSGYTYAVIGNQHTGYTVTNYHVPDFTDLTVEKTWDDKGHEEARPGSVVIRLDADGEPYRVGVMYAYNDWQPLVFADLPKHRNGREIVYTITEDWIRDYTHYIDPLTHRVTNTYTPGRRSIDVEKSWHDEDDTDGIRPESVTIHLLADGRPTGQTLTLSADNFWTGTFENLEDVNAVGGEIDYTVSEDPSPGYEVLIEGYMDTGFDVLNIHEVKHRDLVVNKIWDDAGVESRRPESITVRLNANGVEIQEKRMLREDHWAPVVFSDLPVYRGDREILYTITEDPVENYTHQIDQQSGVITNRYNRRSVPWYDDDFFPGNAFTFTKEWVGEPAEMRFALYYPDGTEHSHRFDRKVLSDQVWQYTAWLSSGAGEYVLEDPIPGYQTIYVNVGAYEDVKDRLYNGGTIINRAIPRTGDTDPLVLWMILGGAGLVILVLVLWKLRHQKK